MRRLTLRPHSELARPPFAVAIRRVARLVRRAVTVFARRCAVTSVATVRYRAQQSASADAEAEAISAIHGHRRSGLSNRTVWNWKPRAPVNGIGVQNDPSLVAGCRCQRQPAFLGSTADRSK